MAYLSGRVPHPCLPCGDVVGDDRAGPDYGAVAYGHSGKDGGVRSDPHVVAYPDGLRHRLDMPAVRRREVVAGSRDADLRPDQHVIADPYVRGIQENAVVVDRRLLPDMDVGPEIATERRAYLGIRVEVLPEQLLEYRYAALSRADVSVEPVAERPGAVHRLQELPQVGVLVTGRYAVAGAFDEIHGHEMQ